jgi:hypothetical protein
MVIGYGGWSVLQEVQRVQLAPVDEAPGVMANLDPLADTAGPRTPDGPEAGAAVAGGDMLERLYRPPALEVPVMVARDGPISSIDPRSGGSRLAGAEAVVDEQAERIAAEAARRGVQETDVAERRVQVVEAGPPRVELLAVRPSWVRVRAADGTVLFEKILDAGERYEVPQTEEPPQLRAGNSGSLYFLVNGETYCPAAPGANVVDNIALAADALRDGFELADLGRDPDLARMVDVAEANGN